MTHCSCCGVQGGGLCLAGVRGGMAAPRPKAGMRFPSFRSIVEAGSDKPDAVQGFQHSGVRRFGLPSYQLVGGLRRVVLGKCM